MVEQKPIDVTGVPASGEEPTNNQPEDVIPEPTPEELAEQARKVQQWNDS